MMKHSSKKHVNQYDEFLKMISPYTLEEAERITGISQAVLIQMAEMIRDADGTAICWGDGCYPKHCRLSYICCNCKPSSCNRKYDAQKNAGAFPLRGHNNVQGAADMGTMPNIFPGYQPVANDEIRAKFEKAYGVTLPAQPGLDNIEMLEAIDKGKLKGMYIVGEDMAWVDADSNHTQDMLSKLDFLVVQEIFLSTTAQFADVILPGAPSLEKKTEHLQIQNAAYNVYTKR
ncbi:hypothetical protein GCM10020331_082830 [Ectobacillus funiculus]